MTAPPNDTLTCPKCGHGNPAKADYCWECRYDFVHDERLKNDILSPPRAPVPPPYSVKPPPTQQAAKPRERVSVYAFAVELIVSTIIVGGSWMLLAKVNPGQRVLPFVGGWLIALAVVKLSEGRLADPETDVREYWSLNPFEYKDNRNWHVLNWHLTLFLPRVVLHTLRRGFMLVFGAR